MNVLVPWHVYLWLLHGRPLSIGLALSARRQVPLAPVTSSRVGIPPGDIEADFISLRHPSRLVLEGGN